MSGLVGPMPDACRTHAEPMPDLSILGPDQIWPILNPPPPKLPKVPFEVFDLLSSKWFTHSFGTVRKFVGDPGHQAPEYSKYWCLGTPGVPGPPWDPGFLRMINENKSNSSVPRGPQGAPRGLPMGFLRAPLGGGGGSWPGFLLVRTCLLKRHNSTYITKSEVGQQLDFSMCLTHSNVEKIDTHSKYY